MELELEGRNVLVTGSSQGIGAGIAALLAAEGARVVVHGRNEARTVEVAASIVERGGDAHVAIGDLSEEDGCAAVVAATRAAVGEVEILINNAGGGKNSRNNPAFFEVPWSDWTATFEQNVGASVRLIHAFVPRMVERGWGRVINISSAVATSPTPNMPDYNAAKAAINNLTVTLSRSLAGTGVTVNTVSPGMVRTPVVEEWFAALGRQNGWGETFEDVESRVVTELLPIASSSIGRTEDVATMVALIASPRSPYVTGTLIRVDGGFNDHVSG